MRPKVWHITAGRDHDGTEWTLCGIKIDWGMDEITPVDPNKWCETCMEKDG